MDVLTPAPQRNPLVPQPTELRESLEQLGILVDEVDASRTFPAKAPAEHVCPQHDVVRGRLAAAIESLLGAVVDAGNAGSRQVDGKRIEYQLAILGHATKTAFFVAFVYLVVVVKHGDDVLAEPGEIPVVVEFRIAKEREV